MRLLAEASTLAMGTLRRSAGYTVTATLLVEFAACTAPTGRQLWLPEDTKLQDSASGRPERLEDSASSRT